MSRMLYTRSGAYYKIEWSLTSERTCHTTTARPPVADAGVIESQSVLDPVARSWEDAALFHLPGPVQPNLQAV